MLKTKDIEILNSKTKKPKTLSDWRNFSHGRVAKLSGSKKLQTNIHMNTMVVYICASLLQLAFKSCDASQTEKKKYFCHHLSNSLNDKYFHSNGQNLSFYVIFFFVFVYLLSFGNGHFSQLEISQVIYQPIADSLNR